MISIDNSGVLNYLDFSSGTFAAKVAYAFNPANAELTITDQSTPPVADTIKIVHVEVSDRFGAIKRASIATAGGNVVIDLDAAPALNLSSGFAIATTVVTNKGLSKDGSAFLTTGILVNAGTVNSEK